MRGAMRRLRHAVRRLRPGRHPHRLFSRAEERRIIAAIQAAEHETSGEIRLHVEAHCADDAYARAREVFVQYDHQAINMTDSLSFAIMERLRLGQAFTFDPDFTAHGFSRVPASKA